MQLRSSLVLVACLLVFSNLGSHASASAETLSSAVRTAVATNPRVLAAQSNRNATDYTLDQAIGRFFPEIELSGDVGKQKIDRPEGLGPQVNDVWRDRRQVTLSVRQVLFDGFDRANEYYRNQARVTSAAYRVLARAELVALNAIEAFIDVRRHGNLLVLADRNIKRHRSLLSLIQAQVEGGKATESDLNQTRERLEAALALRAQIEVALETAKAKFEAAVGHRPHRLKQVRYPKQAPRSRKAAYQAALEQNPHLAALRSEVDAAEFSKEKFKSSLYPQLFLEGSAMRGEELGGTPGRNDELKAMVTLRWTLFDGGARNARVNELEARRYERQAEVDIRIREIQESIGIAWARYSTGRKQLEAIRRQVQRNRVLTDQYREEFNAGKRSLLDVLDAENSRFGSEFDLSNVGAIHLFASYELLGHMGTLLTHLGIEQPAGGPQTASKSNSLVTDPFTPAQPRSRRSFLIPSLR